MRAPRSHPRAAPSPVPAVRALAVALAALVVPSAARAGDAEARAVAPGLMPNVPEAVSRPAGWPQAGSAENAARQAVAAAVAEAVPAAPAAPADAPRADGSVDPDRHVISSIRSVPGGPLAAAAAGPSGVVPAAHGEPAAPPGAVPEAVSLEAAMIVARVGPEVVLESDLLTPKALEWLESVSSGLEPEQVRQLRLQICRQVIDQHVETLIVYVDACREIPADKLPEIRKNVDKAFDEQMLPNLMKEAGAANSLEFELALRAKGQSLERMRKMFFERGLAQEWLRKNAKVDGEIPHADMIAWYQNHLADYDIPARARYEALTVKTGLKRSRREAWDILATMGNEVLAGRPFAEVARAKSEGPTAAAGGAFEWTTCGSLASKSLDEALFSLPVGQLSAIIEDETALHIVRVVEREAAGRTPFLEAQVEIRKTLEEQRRTKAVDEYLAKLRERTPVWTVFDAGGTAAIAGPAGGRTVRR